MKKDELKKLRPLVQLVPAAAVVALVMVTLPHSRPVLAAVPERLAAPVEQSEEETQPEMLEAETTLLPYADGVYTGSAQGYGGLITVQVTMEGGRITDIQILDASHETASFFNRAKTLVETVLTRQSWEVDTVSGATYSSRGILGAIQNALTGEQVKTETPEKTEPAPLVSESFSAPATYRDGVYTGSAQGFGGLITVQVTISGGVITDVTVLSADGETPSYFSRAQSVLSAVVSAGSPNVDTVSGATYSSNGILNAVKRALNQAAADGTEQQPVEEPDVPAEEPIDPTLRPEEDYLDGVYTGTGEGYGGEVTVSVTVADGRIADIQLVSAADETPSFLERAMAVLTAIQSGQTTEVDAVSGATYSSEGLKEAVRNALEQAKSQQPEPTPDPVPEPDPTPNPNPTPDPDPVPDPEPIDPTPEPGLPPYLDGTYSATAVCTDEDLFCYDVRVELVVQDGVLTSVTVTKENDTSESPEDNENYLDYAINGRTYKNTWFEGVVSQILQKQGADEVDTVSRATYSSRAIQSAAQQALEQAKSTEEDEA